LVGDHLSEQASIAFASGSGLKQLTSEHTHMRPLSSARLIAVLLLLAGNALGQSTYQNSSLPPAQRAADLVAHMTLQEKAAQSINSAPAIPRLGVPAYDYWSEGLHGVSHAGYATLFPQAIGMAATWDPALVQDIGTAISIEARAKYNQAIRENIHSIYFGLTLWSPNINIFRDPRWGRGQETFGEDPFLTATMAGNIIRGLQGNDPRYYRVIATPKHFAVHSGPEIGRHSFNVDPSLHDLWDTYLPAFRASIVDAKAGSIMCSYNAIDGTPACASDLLLKQILRQDWQFKGFVTSDCGGIDDLFKSNAHHFSGDQEHAVATAVLAGTDTSCGKTYLALPAAVQQGLLTEADVDRSLERLFEARIRLGMFDPPQQVPYAAIPFSEVGSPAHAALALKAARESMVLLKNEKRSLPLSPSIKTIAVVGPNASTLASIEGNYNAVAKDPVLPLDGIRREFSSKRVLYAQGASYSDGLPVTIPRTQFHPSPGSKEEGLKAEFFANENWKNAPAVTRIDPQIDFDWNAASPVPGFSPRSFSVRWTGVIQMPAPGDYPIMLSLPQCYQCHTESFSIAVDGKQLTAVDASDPRAVSTPAVTLHVGDTGPHSIEVRYAHRSSPFGAVVALSWIPPAPVLLEQAKAAAAQADVVVAFVGLSPLLEGESMPLRADGFAGGDRTDIALPASQQHLLEAMSATGKPLIVVSMSGSAVAYTWAKANASAVLQAWYPGQAGAQAIAETLSGKNNPSGRLPVTFYSSVDQLPAFTDYGMKQRTYRYFSGHPLFPFGFGLSYSQFEYAGLKLSTQTLHAGDTLRADADVKNISDREGEEVVELYLIPPGGANGGLSPRLQLEGLQRVHLHARESAHVVFSLNPRQLSEVDARGVRSVQSGAYLVSVGGAQPPDDQGPGQMQTARFHIEGQMELPH
jgi:beta-glucosidase